MQRLGYDPNDARDRLARDVRLSRRIYDPHWPATPHRYAVDEDDESPSVAFAGGLFLVITIAAFAALLYMTT